MFNLARFLMPRVRHPVVPAVGAGGKLALYASVGPELTHYDVDVDGATLTRRGTVSLPSTVQYVWPHASRKFLYVATSSGGPRSRGDRHFLSVLRVDLATGALAMHGEPVPLPYRPIHVTTDMPSRHVLTSYNDPSTLTVHKVREDGTIGALVPQSAALDFGIYAHQIRIYPSNRMAVLVTRGNSAANGKAEDPGALKVFDYREGVLGGGKSIAPDGGYGYGPRHVDFHPTLPWMFASLERQNRLCVYRLHGDTVEPQACFTLDTLAEPGNVRAGQAAGTLHVHPNGRYVYVANRAGNTVQFAGRPVFAGGENSIAVYECDAGTGEPRLIQHVDTHGMRARTFALDPGGRMLVAANLIALDVRDGDTIRNVPANLAVFRVGGDGRLEFVHKYDVDVGDQTMFWTGIVSR